MRIATLILVLLLSFPAYAETVAIYMSARIVDVWQMEPEEAIKWCNHEQTTITCQIIDQKIEKLVSSSQEEVDVFENHRVILVNFE